MASAAPTDDHGSTSGEELNLTQVCAPRNLSFLATCHGLLALPPRLRLWAAVQPRHPDHDMFSRHGLVYTRKIILRD